MSDAQSPNLILAKANSSRLVGKNSLNFSVPHRTGAAITPIRGEYFGGEIACPSLSD